MGFLKFLKREKKEESIEDLDLPPAPPPLEGFEKDMPEPLDFHENKGKIPSMHKKEDIPDLPSFPEIKDMPKFDFPEESKVDLGDNADDFSTLPELPEIEEKPIAPIPPIRAPPVIKEHTPEPKSVHITPPPVLKQELFRKKEPIPSTPEIHPKIERRLFAQRPIDSGEVPSRKTIYVRVDDFRAALGSINMIRRELKRSEEALMKLENIKNSKDKSFYKVRSSLDDLQRKLIFVDKTLFKGE